MPNEVKNPRATSPLFTVFLDWRGATYVLQLCAADVGDAVKQWSLRLADKGIEGLTSAGVQQLTSSLQEDSPVPVRECVNVWCVSALVQDDLALIHVVATAVPVQRLCTEGFSGNSRLR
jgi:hypothetical protein